LLVGLSNGPFKNQIVPLWGVCPTLGTTALETEFPLGIESIEKVLNCKISFQDLEKVLNLAKMYMKY